MSIPCAANYVVCFVNPFAGDAGSWEFTHRCAGAWPFIRSTITKDTQAAFQQWAADSNVSLPAYEPNDVVIQSRCAPDTVLSHGEYGPVAFSFYANIPPDTKRVFIVTELKTRTSLCAQLHHAQQAHLQRLLPDANVSVIGGAPAEDFARLLFAPILYKDASSSFGLWAAVANTGVVHSTPLLSWYSSHNLTPFMGLNWHWSEAPALYPSVANRLNLTADNPERIIQWLQLN